MKESSYTHFILYAKHQYQRQELIADLKRLISIRSGVNVEHVTMTNIATVLLDAYQDIRGGENISENHLRDILLENLNPKSLLNTMFKVKDEYHVMLFNSILSMISISPVRTKQGDCIVRLGDPDINILPLSMDEQTSEDKSCE